ncbi:hypothetical protein J6590_089800 [Homalodisca vitripennis]|nr:hypothetical protein J6590_089800 [Homalodisca vitripennis]
MREMLTTTSEYHASVGLELSAARFRCTGCRTLFKSSVWASVHLPKCMGCPVPIGVLCPDCGRAFPNKRGQGVHRIAHHPELVNAECLWVEDRRAAGAAEPPKPTRPRSSGWSEDEDRTFIRRYLELKSTGRAMGYCLIWYCLYVFVALDGMKNRTITSYGGVAGTLGRADRRG